MNDTEKWALITRYISGEANPDEVEIFEDWLASHPENKELFDEVKNLWVGANPAIGDFDSNETYDALWAQIAVSQASGRQIDRPARSARTVRWFAPWLQIAATLLVLVVASAVGYSIYNDVFSSPSWITVENPEGKKSMNTLPDGSIVWLNAGSKLMYQEKFDRNKREVMLSGEAFFQVKEDKTAPFHVRTGAIQTTVLGTSFNIQSNPDEGKISVAVLTGKVKISRNTEDHAQVLGLLKPNEKLLFDAQKNSFQIITVANAYQEASWKDGVLRFRDMNFGEIAARLENWYGVTVKFQNEAIRQCELDGTFTNVPLEKVLKMLSMTAGFQYEITGKQVLISGRDCN
jgi:transmembrane sensor